MRNRAFVLVILGLSLIKSPRIPVEMLFEHVLKAFSDLIDFSQKANLIIVIYLYYLALKMRKC